MARLGCLSKGDPFWGMDDRQSVPDSGGFVLTQERSDGSARNPASSNNSRGRVSSSKVIQSTPTNE